MTDQALWVHGDDDDGSGDDDADQDDNDADGNNDRGDMFFQVVNCGHNLYSPEGETTSAIVQVQS